MLSVGEQLLSNLETERLLNAQFTYAEVGHTRDRLPSDFHQFQHLTELGSGRERFEEARQALFGWDMHRRAGLTVRSSTEHVAEESVAVLRLGVGVLGVDAPVRVVYVVDEPDRQGFAYGTLPGHPERGEESFILELRDDTVTFTITAFSRPATLLFRVAGPISRFVQSRVTTRYLNAV